MPIAVRSCLLQCACIVCPVAPLPNLKFGVWEGGMSVCVHSFSAFFFSCVWGGGGVSAPPTHLCRKLLPCTCLQLPSGYMLRTFMPLVLHAFLHCVPRSPPLPKHEILFFRFA